METPSKLPIPSTRNDASAESGPTEPASIVSAANTTIAAARDFAKSLVTVSVSVLGVYVTLLSWAVPRSAANQPAYLDSTTALCLTLPILDFALAIVGYALAFFGAGFQGGFAPSTFESMRQFHAQQLKWVRTGSTFLVIGLLAGFAMLGRFLLAIDPAVAISFEYFAAILSGTIAVVAAMRVTQGRYVALLAIAAWVFPIVGLSIVIGGKWGVTLAVVAGGCLLLIAVIAVGAAIVYIVLNAKSS